LELVNINSLEQRYIRSSSGMGLGHVTCHPSRKYFAVAEKGISPNILVFEYPSMKLFRLLRKGTQLAYSCIDFNPKGNMLASVGSNPDYQLTVWDWKQESIILRTKVSLLVVFASHSSDAMIGVLV
jgi:WD40 repeat protein